MEKVFSSIWKKNGRENSYNPVEAFLSLYTMQLFLKVGSATPRAEDLRAKYRGSAIVQLKIRGPWTFQEKIESVSKMYDE